MLNVSFFTGYGRVLYALAMPDGKMQEEEKEVVLELVTEELLPVLKRRLPAKFQLTSDILFACESDDAATQNAEEAFDAFITTFDAEEKPLTKEQDAACLRIIEQVTRAFRQITPEVDAVLEKCRERLS